MAKQSKKLASYRLDPHTLQQIEDIKRELGIKNSTDVIRKALVFTKAVVDNQQQGGSLIVDGKAVVIL